jgi:hypothetical protein
MPIFPTSRRLLINGALSMAGSGSSAAETIGQDTGWKKPQLVLRCRRMPLALPIIAHCERRWRETTGRSRPPVPSTTARQRRQNTIAVGIPFLCAPEIIQSVIRLNRSAENSHLPRLDPGVHVFKHEREDLKTWMAGSSPAKAATRRSFHLEESRSKPPVPSAAADKRLLRRAHERTVHCATRPRLSSPPTDRIPIAGGWRSPAARSRRRAKPSNAQSALFRSPR